MIVKVSQLVYDFRSQFLSQPLRHLQDQGWFLQQPKCSRNSPVFDLFKERAWLFQYGPTRVGYNFVFRVIPIFKLIFRHLQYDTSTASAEVKRVNSAEQLDPER